MQISKTAYIILVVSMVIGLVLMVSAFVFTKLKIQKIKKKHKNLVDNTAMWRKNYGLLLWELKNNSKEPLDDIEMEFIINTALRNKYKTFQVKGFPSLYESKTLIQIAKMTQSNDSPDLTLVSVKANFIEVFNSIFSHLCSNQMIVFTHTLSKKSEVKKFIKKLQLNTIPYERVSYGQGLILVVK